MSKEIITNELIIEEIRRNRQELKATIEAVEVRILLKLEEQKEKINELEVKYTELARKVEDIDKKQKVNNIIIFGLQKKPHEINIESISSEIKKLLDIDVGVSDVNNIYPLGSTENCPVKLEFVSYLKKQTILRNAKKLKGTNISISNDMTYKEREEYKTLKKYLVIAKQDQNNICYIKKHKLYINNKIYTAQELEQCENTEDDESQSKSAPATPTYLNINRACSVRHPAQTLWKNKHETPSDIADHSTKETKEVEELAKKIGREIKDVEAVAKKIGKETKEKARTRSQK